MGNTATEWPFVQSREEFEANSKVVDEWLVEKGWALSKVPFEDRANFSVLIGYMAARFTVNGKINATVENIKSAIAESHRADKLIWAEGRAPKKVGRERSALRESDPLGLEARGKAIEATKKQKDHEAAESLVQRLKVWAKNYVSHPHSKTYRIREKLATMLPASTTGMTLAQAEALEKQLRAAADSLEA